VSIGTYTVVDCVADVRRRAMIPNSTAVLSNDDITSFLNDEMYEYIVPLLIGTAEEYLVHVDDPFVPTERVVPIPADAVGTKIRDIQIQSATTWISLPRIEPEYEGQFFATGNIQGYMFRGDKIILTPAPNGTNTIRISYYKRPTALSYGSMVPGIPLDLIPLLVQRAVVRCLEALGDERAEAAEARAARVEQKCIELISPRGEGSPRVVINYNGPGWTYRRRPYYMR
jgi:hypothetical protein